MKLNLTFAKSMFVLSRNPRKTEGFRLIHGGTTACGRMNDIQIFILVYILRIESSLKSDIWSFKIQ